MMVSIEVVRGAPGLQEFQILSDYAVGCFCACLVGWVCAGGCRPRPGASNFAGPVRELAEFRGFLILGGPFNKDPTTVFRVLY